MFITISCERMSAERRAMNYTPQEKEMLLDIIKEYPIIQSKLLTNEAIQQKYDTWTEITERYNANATSGHRTRSQLGVLYRNIKHKTKRMANGRSPQQKPQENEMQDTLISKDYDEKPQQKPQENKMKSTFIIKDGNIKLIRPEMIKVEYEGKPSTSQDSKIKEKKKTMSKERKMQIKRILNYKEHYIKTKLDTARLQKQYMIQKQMLIIRSLRNKIKALEGKINCSDTSAT